MTDKRIKVLLIEDNPGDVRLVQEMISEAANVDSEIESVEGLDAGLERLAEGGVDLLLLDLGLPDSQGLETLIKAQGQAGEVPIIVLTGLDDEELGLRAVKMGAQDYLIKGQVYGNLVARAISYAIERKKTEKLIKASLREKEVLLQEINHRVKNNMQIISSLLKIQSALIKDETALDLIHSTQNRVKSMALIHETLYKSKDLARVNFGEYSQSLIKQLSSSYGTVQGNILLKADIKNVFLDINTAIPCGLIINELVSNALKHAFPEGEKGEIKINMSPLNKNKIELIVSDNGVGLPKELDFRKTKSLGLHLVTILAEDQLHGEVKLDRTKGTSFRLRLKIKK
jgi:two-component sensor histidine kinase